MVRRNVLRCEVILPFFLINISLRFIAVNNDLQSIAITIYPAFVHEIDKEFGIPTRFTQQGRRRLKQRQPGNRSLPPMSVIKLTSTSKPKAMCSRVFQTAARTAVSGRCFLMGSDGTTGETISRSAKQSEDGCRVAGYSHPTDTRHPKNFWTGVRKTLGKSLVIARFN